MPLPHLAQKTKGRHSVPIGGRRQPRDQALAHLPLICGDKAFEFFLLPFQPCFTLPYTLQIVAHVEREPPAACDFELDFIAVLQSEQAAMMSLGAYGKLHSALIAFGGAEVDGVALGEWDFLWLRDADHGAVKFPQGATLLAITMR